MRTVNVVTEVIKMFSAYDLQCYRYLHIGRNRKSGEECKEEICDFLLEGSGLDIEDIEKWKEAGHDEILECFEVRIDEHKEKIEMVYFFDFGENQRFLSLN